MGIRLYPILVEGATDAQILGISEESEKLFKSLDREDLYDLIYGEDSEKYEDLRMLNSFDVFGWGKFLPLAEMRDGQYIPPSGELEDLDACRRLFALNDIDCSSFIHLIKGVYWC